MIPCRAFPGFAMGAMNLRPPNSFSLLPPNQKRIYFPRSPGRAVCPQLLIMGDGPPPKLPYLVGAGSLMDGQLRRAGGSHPDSEFLYPVTKRVWMKVQDFRRAH